MLGDALMQLAHLADAERAYGLVLHPALARTWGRDAVNGVATCAVWLNDTRALDRLSSEPIVQQFGRGDYVRTMLDCARGRTIDLRDLEVDRVNTTWHDVLLSSDVSLSVGFESDAVSVGRQVGGMPYNRLAWLLLEQCARRWRFEEDDGFYEGLEWMWPDDPVIRSAVAEWRARGGRRSTVDPEAVIKRIRPLSGNPPKPWTIAAALRTLLERADFDGATRFAQVCQEELGGWGEHKMAFTNHLVHRVAELRAATSGPSTGPITHP